MTEVTFNKDNDRYAAHMRAYRESLANMKRLSPHEAKRQAALDEYLKEKPNGKVRCND